MYGPLAESKKARSIPLNSIKIGDIVQVKIEDVDEYDLFGEIIRKIPWKPKIPELEPKCSSI